MIDDIIEHLEKGEGGDRDLDIKIWLAVTPGATHTVKFYEIPDRPDGPHPFNDTRDANGHHVGVPLFTASVDVAAGWIAKNLPGFGHGYSAKGDGKALGQVEAPDLANVPFSAMASSPARALTAAALRAFKERRDAPT